MAMRSCEHAAACTLPDGIRVAAQPASAAARTRLARATTSSETAHARLIWKLSRWKAGTWHICFGRGVTVEWAAVPPGRQAGLSLFGSAGEQERARKQWRQPGDRFRHPAVPAILPLHLPHARVGRFLGHFKREGPPRQQGRPEVGRRDARDEQAHPELGKRGVRVRHDGHGHVQSDVDQVKDLGPHLGSMGGWSGEGRPVFSSAAGAGGF